MISYFCHGKIIFRQKGNPRSEKILAKELDVLAAYVFDSQIEKVHRGSGLDLAIVVKDQKETKAKPLITSLREYSQKHPLLK